MNNLKKITHCFRWPVAVMLSLILVGCGGKNDKIKHAEAFVAKTEQTKGAPIQPLPQFSTPELPLTTPALKRNPFAPMVNNNMLKPDTAHPKTPLESYPLSQLHLVGILSQQNKIWGLISSPDGSIYNIEVGQYIGQNYGQVTEITPEKIVVQETLSDGLGGWLIHTKELPITSGAEQDSSP